MRQGWHGKKGGGTTEKRVGGVKKEDYKHVEGGEGDNQRRIKGPGEVRGENQKVGGGGTGECGKHGYKESAGASKKK